MNVFIERVKQLSDTTDELYIYGAGMYGRNVYQILQQNNIKVNGFVCTKKEGINELFGLPVILFSEVKKNNIGLILGVNSNNAVAVKDYIGKCKFDMEQVIDGGAYIENNKIRFSGREEETFVEITTRIGCKVNCKYCPQDILIKNYFRQNKRKDMVMSLETFKICLDKLPKDCTVVFSGFAEPFLNPMCVDMMRLTHESGRKIDLYTTMVGLDKIKLMEILKIPFNFVVLHVADEKGYAEIPVTKEYLEMLKIVVDYKKANGEDFLNFCNAQAEPDRRIREIFIDKKEILTTLQDRAGNIEGEALCSKKSLEGSLYCSFCGTTLKRNILLPDGSMVLCCNDFGMKHVIGNLLSQSYREIRNGDVLKYIKEGMSGDMSKNILCRNCSCANLI